MSDINNRTPVKMEFTIASITEGVEYWLNKVVLKDDLTVGSVTWDNKTNTFSVTLVRGIK